MEFADGVFMTVKRNDSGICTDVLPVCYLFSALVECDSRHGQTVFLSPYLRASVRCSILAVVHFIDRFGMQRRCPVGATRDGAVRGISMSIFVVSQSPVVHVLPLRVEGRVVEDFIFVARLICVAGAVRFGVPAIQYEIRLRKTVAVREFNIALYVIFFSGRSRSAVGVIHHGVAQPRIDYVSAAGICNENRHIVPLTHIENVIKAAVHDLSRSGSEHNESTCVFISLRKHDDAHRILLAICEDPHKHVKPLRGIHRAFKFFPAGYVTEFSLCLKIYTACSFDVNFDTSV